MTEGTTGTVWSSGARPGWRPWIEATTLGDLLDRQAVERPGHEAVVFPDERATYRDLASRAEFFARGLVGLGVNAGDHIGIFLPASISYLAALLGASKIGAVPVPISDRFKAFELQRVIPHSDMKVLLTALPGDSPVDLPALLAETFQDLPRQQAPSLDLVEAPELDSMVLVGEGERAGFLGRDDFAAAAERVSREEVGRRQQRVRVRDTAVTLYTSGTEATPKGALLSHEAFVRAGHAMAQTRFFLAPEDRVWAAFPMFHIGAIAHAVMCLTAGCTFCHTGVFNPERALDLLESERCTVAVPAFETVWLPVLDHPRFGAADLSALRIVMNVGVDERLRGMQERMPHAVQISSFGATESCSHLALNHLDDSLEKRVTTGGHPLPGMECRVVDPVTGLDVPTDTPGELLYRGPDRFDGYYKDPELSARVIDEDGFFHSGDVATMDDEGRVTFVSRLKDMLKVGGENVAAAEIEGYLLRHPAIAIVQVVAAPDARYVEVAAAFVELKDGAAATEAELIEFCRGKIATFKIPRYVRFLNEWPMSGTKIKKYVLREWIRDELAEKGINEAPRMSSQSSGSQS